MAFLGDNDSNCICFPYVTGNFSAPSPENFVTVCHGFRWPLSPRFVIIEWCLSKCDQMVVDYYSPLMSCNMVLILSSLQIDNFMFVLLNQVKWNLLRRISHKTDTSLRRTLSHVSAERRCISYRMISIRRTTIKRIPL